MFFTGFDMGTAGAREEGWGHTVDDISPALP